jgi:spermidine synthase
VKPNLKLAETTTPDGARLTLHEHDGTYCIRVNTEKLMHSSMHASELMLADLATEPLVSHEHPSVLIGGLGLGFTLKRVLEKLGPKSTVHVAELIPAVVAWNREFLAGLNGALLGDPRVEVFSADVWDVIARAGPARYDSVLLDIDNGPAAMVQKQNNRLYGRAGLERIATVLKPGGRMVVWSAFPDPAFAQRLAGAGYTVQIVPAKLYPNAKRYAYTLFVADRCGAGR